MLPIQLYLNPSLLLARLIWLGWLGLCILITSAWQTDIPLNSWVLIAWIYISFVCTQRWLKQHAWQVTSNAIVALHITHNNWIVTLKAGTQIAVSPHLGCRFWPWLTVLRMHCQAKKTYWVIILPDQVCPDTWRRLRVMGRWGR